MYRLYRTRRVFSEKTDVLPPHFSFFTAVTSKIRSRSPKSNQFFVTSQLYIHENLRTIGSQDIVQTRKCHANADANGIWTKNSMSPSP